MVQPRVFPTPWAGAMTAGPQGAGGEGSTMTTYDTRPVPNATPADKQGVDVSKCGGAWHNTFAPYAVPAVPAPITGEDTARRPSGRRIVDELLTGVGITCAAVLAGLLGLVIAGLAGWIH